MAAGLAVHGVCLADASAAAAYACGTSWPVAAVMPTTGGPVSVLAVCSASGEGVVQVDTYQGGTLVASVSQPVAFGACDTADWQSFYPFAMSAADGALVAGAVAAVWGAAWGVRALRSVLRDPGESV